MGISERLIGLKGEMMHVTNLLRVAQRIDNEDKNAKISEIIDIIDALTQEVISIKNDNNSIQNRLSEMLEEML